MENNRAFMIYLPVNALQGKPRESPWHRIHSYPGHSHESIQSFPNPHGFFRLQFFPI